MISRTRLGLLGAVLLYLFRAWPSLWTTVDDAWISARYSAQLAAGNGLVYNAGEPAIEGYTNLAWTVWLALGLKIGFDPVPFVVFSGLFMGAIAVWLAGEATQSLLSKTAPWWIPVAVSLWLGLDIHHAVSSTNGLETSMFVAALMGGIWAASTLSSPLVVGLLLGGLATVRPEGLAAGPLFAGIFLFHPERGFQKKSILPILSGIFGVWSGLSIWRWLTYGALIPNTFAAKATGGMLRIAKRNIYYLGGDWYFWVTALVGLLGLFAVSTRAPRRLLLGILALAITLAAFRVNMWMPAGRLLVPAATLVLVGVGASAEQRAGRALLTLLLISAVIQPFFGDARVRAYDRRHSVILPNPTSQAAQRLSEQLPKGSWLAVRDAGVLAFFIGTDMHVAELHNRALTQLHPDGINAQVLKYTPKNPAVIALTQSKIKAHTIRYGGDRKVFRRAREPYVYLGRVKQHYHRFYDLYIRRDLHLPPLPEELVLNHEGPAAPNGHL